MIDEADRGVVGELAERGSPQAPMPKATPKNTPRSCRSGRHQFLSEHDDRRCRRGEMRPMNTVSTALAASPA